MSGFSVRSYKQYLTDYNFSSIWFELNLSLFTVIFFNKSKIETKDFLNVELLVSQKIPQTFSCDRWKSLEIVRTKPGRPDFTQKLLVQGQWEGDVDDGKVVDGKTAKNSNQEKVQRLLKAVWLEPKINGNKTSLRPV